MSNTFEIRDLRQQDWIWSSKFILFHPEVDASMYKVYCGLSSYADNKTQEAFPSQNTLAKRLHIGKSTVIRALQKIEAAKLIRIEKSQGEHNIYYLLNIIGEVPQSMPRKKKEEKEAVTNWVKDILEWAEQRKGAKFVNYGKQIGALGLMKKAGYDVEEVKKCYAILEKDDFWQGRGFDFTTVANELPKKVAQIRTSNKQNGIFDSLTVR